MVTLGIRQKFFKPQSNSPIWGRLSRPEEEVTFHMATRWSQAEISFQTYAHSSGMSHNDNFNDVLKTCFWQYVLSVLLNMKVHGLA